jgi:hypothetical protein
LIRSVHEIAKPDTRFGYYYLILWVIPGFMTWRETLRKGFRYSFGENFQRDGKKTYEKHNALIRSLVPKEKLLEFRATDGWKPLCEFLGQPVPDCPFPHVNEKDAMKRGIMKIYVLLTIKALFFWALYGTMAYLIVTRVMRFFS